MRPAVVIEISERWLKMIVGRPSARQAVHGVVKPIQGLSDEQITQAVSGTLRELKLKARQVTLCLPRNLVTVRNLHLPSQAPAEIAQMIDLNIVRMVPYRKEEVVSNYRLLGVDEIGYSKVMLAIVHRELVKRYVSILEPAGLSVERISLSSHGAWRYLMTHQASAVGAEELVLLLEIDAAFTDCLLCSRDQLYFSRNLAVEAEQLTEEAGLTRLLSEINQSLEIFQNEEMNRRPAKVFISGAQAAAPMVERAVGEDLKIPVVRVAAPIPQPWPGSPGASAVPATCSVSAPAQLLGSEPGQELGFILPEIQIRQFLKEKMRELVLAGSLTIFLLAVGVGFFLGRLYHQQAYLWQLQHRNAAIKHEIGDVVVQSRRIELVKSYLMARELPLRYLAELQRVVPAEVAIDFLSVDEQQRGVLRGQAIQLSDVFKLITTLENSRYLEQVDAKYTRRKKVHDKEVTEFELTLKVHL